MYTRSPLLSNRDLWLRAICTASLLPALFALTTPCSRRKLAPLVGSFSPGCHVDITDGAFDGALVRLRIRRRRRRAPRLPRRRVRRAEQYLFKLDKSRQKTKLSYFFPFLANLLDGRRYKRCWAWVLGQCLLAALQCTESANSVHLNFYNFPTKSSWVIKWVKIIRKADVSLPCIPQRCTAPFPPE